MSLQLRLRRNKENQPKTISAFCVVHNVSVQGTPVSNCQTFEIITKMPVVKKLNPKSKIAKELQEDLLHEMQLVFDRADKAKAEAKSNHLNHQLIQDQIEEEIKREKAKSIKLYKDMVIHLRNDPCADHIL